MNTIGKILVILNFLFAVIVGIVMVMVTGLRTQWKDAYIEQEKQAKVVVAQRDAYAKVNIGLAGDNRSMKSELESMSEKVLELQSIIKAQEKTQNIKIKEFENQAIAAQTALQQSLITQKRQADQITVLEKTISDREALIVKLEADIKVVRVQAQNFESLARARQIQNENLLEQVRDLTRTIARLESGVNPDSINPRDPNSPNMPAVAVDGRIEKVDDKDNSLIQISLGTDHGVAKNHTLIVYRTRPEPKYLGMVRVVEAYHQKSVAQLMTSGNQAFRPQLLKDDLVTSKLVR